MTLFVCVDDEGGMAFGGRRQSRDSIVFEDIFSECSGEPLLIAPYSEKLLSPLGRVKVKRDPLGAAKRRSFVFLEDRAAGEDKEKVDRLIIYRWNRHYPADLYFDIDPTECALTLESSTELVGTSHEKITKEIYIK